MSSINNDSKDHGLQVGARLHIYTYAEDSVDEKETILVTRIAEVFRRELAIEIPIEKGSGRMRHLLQGEDITVTFVGENNLVYSFPSKVNRSAVDKIPLLIIEKPSESVIARIQRRNYLRVPIELNLDIILQNPVKMERVETVDLSGGGLTFKSTEASLLSSGQMIAGVLHLPEDNILKDIHFSGVIVRKVEANKKRPFSLYAIQFLEIEERDRDRIIRLCFQRQLDLRKK